jgi:hypothetical protein
MIRIGGALQTPYEFHEIGSRMVAKGRLVLAAQGSHIRAQARRIFAIGLETWICEQMVESQGAAERWPLALFVWATPRELPEGEHDGVILRLPAGIRRIIGTPAVVAFPGIRVILGRDLNRLHGIQRSQL